MSNRYPFNTISLAESQEEMEERFNRGLALVDAEVAGVSDHTVLELLGVARQATTPRHTEQHNVLREAVANGEVPPIIIRPSGLLQTRFDAIGMHIGNSIAPVTHREPLSVEDGYFLWYLQAGDSLKEHRDDTSGNGIRIGMPLGGLALFKAANYGQGILGSPSLIVQNLRSPISHGATNLTPGRLVAVWDIETENV